MLPPKFWNLDLSIFLLVESSDASGAPAKLLKELAKGDFTQITITPDEMQDLPEHSTVVTYLSDSALVNVVNVAAERQWHLAVMPHPKMRHMRIGFGISNNLDEAIEDFRKAEQPATVDLLRCNGIPVMNAVLIGESAGLLLGIERGLGWWERMKRFVGEYRRLSGYAPAAYEITTQKNKKISTAAVGVVVVEHGANSSLSRKILEESSIQDGMLHALVLAPQSWLEMLGFFFRSIVLRPSTPARLPSFAGHIKTSELLITSGREIPYVIDGAAKSAKEFIFNVTKDGIRIYPGRFLEWSREIGTPKEIHRVQSLPSAEARRDLVLKPLPYLRHAATDDFKDLFLILRENARSTPSFIVLMILSVLLAACGLYADSSPVIIGAMILAPLMAPIISLSMGISRQDQSLIITSVTTLGRGILLAMGCAAIVAVLLPLQSITREISARLSPNLLDLGVAVLSGIAGAYAHARQEIARSLAGVAIAVALVPPLVVSGIGVGWFNWDVFFGAFLLFLTNLVGILFAATITFSLLGFSPLAKARRGLFMSLAMVAVISIPLGYSFLRLVDAQRTAETIEGLRVDDIVVRDVVATRRDGRKVIRCNLVCPAENDNPWEHAGSCQKVYGIIRQRLGEEAIVEATVIYRSD